ncbi:cyclic nucleotide-binding protein [Treponema primitia ZAS-2]|uniref:Cyclic nucleotide-binding protein n=1 Tax=Treponema primitia (strain ATCC BAA-887 / DSM 12427 / ZAS-2) TaxID=545694 RepID=F5YPM7_TREPZ|nr:cyclic nucleotide-binding domain-containing protein [Treponema primitia]AEF86785.1 cyclic nucleotide-binding protein [Treponema primitia ZAS-2]
MALLPEADLSVFARFTRTFKPGEMIFSEFEPGDTFYLIQEGRVELVKVLGDVEKTLDILQPPETFGEMAILENSPRSATAIALDKVQVLEFNRKNFEILISGNPQIALKLLRTFARRLYDSKRKFMILTLEEPQARIADVFLMLDEQQADNDKTIDRREFRTTVDDIAHWAAMSVNEAREIINHFVTQRRMELLSDRIVVKNINDFSRYVNSRRRQIL